MVFVRHATVADVAGIGRIEVEAWRETYAGILPERLLVDMSPRQRARSWTALIGRDGGNVVVACGAGGALLGFGNCGAQRGTMPGLAGEIYTLYVAPERQNEGIGRQLLIALFRRLTERGLPSALVWVLERNPSRFFYERTGGTLAGRRRLLVGGAEIDAVAYAWRDLPLVLRAQAGTDRPISE